MFWRKRIKDPVDGFAEIVECWKRDADGDSGNCRMKLALDVPGIPAQVVDHHEAAMNANRWPEVGMRVAVTVDAKHPDDVGKDPQTLVTDLNAAFARGEMTYEEMSDRLMRGLHHQ